MTPNRSTAAGSTYANAMFLIPALQTLKLAPVTFGWAATARLAPSTSMRLNTGRFRAIVRHRLRRFVFIEQLGFWCWAAPHAQGLDLQDADVLVGSRGDHVTGFHSVTWLGDFDRVDPDLTSLDLRRSQGTRFDSTAEPQPTIQPLRLCTSLLTCHFRRLSGVSGLPAHRHGEFFSFDVLTSASRNALSEANGESGSAMPDFLGGTAD